MGSVLRRIGVKGRLKSGWESGWEGLKSDRVGVEEFCNWQVGFDDAVDDAAG